MAFWLSQNLIRGGESTDSKTMIPLIQIELEKLVNGRFDRVRYSSGDEYICAVDGDDWQ